METKYDLIIVGGGVAGSLLAYQLMKQAGSGCRILILEAGDDRSAERTEMALAYAYSPNKSPASPYNKKKDSPVTFPDKTKPEDSDYYRYASGSSEFKSTYVRIGGGSTWHFLGNVPRLLPRDFKMYSHYQVGEDWPISYEDLKSFYGKAEKEMGVSGNTEQWRSLYEEDEKYEFPMPEIWPTYSDQVLRRKLDGLLVDGNKITVRSTPQARNSQNYQGRPPCAGNSSCVPICPIGAKYDAGVHLKKGQQLGVEVSFKSIVFKLDTEGGKEIKNVHYRDWEGNEKVASSTFVVVANHAIESAILLLNSGVANSSGLVGANLMDHPQGYGVGLSGEPLYPFRGPPTTSGIDAFRDGEFRKSHAAFRLSIGNDGWGRWNGEDKLETILNEFTNPSGTFLIGKELKTKVADHGTRIFRFSFSTEMLPEKENCVRLHPTEVDKFTKLPLPLIDFKIDRKNSYNQNAFSFASHVMLKMFSALEVVDKPQTISTIDRFSGAGHIMGTTKMGSDRSSAVVDKNCRSFDHPNLFIVGAGVFTTCGTANPTLTVAALSLRLADYLFQQIKKGE